MRDVCATHQPVATAFLIQNGKSKIQNGPRRALRKIQLKKPEAK
jgi:hypothetical protein